MLVFPGVVKGRNMVRVGTNQKDLQPTRVREWDLKTFGEICPAHPRFVAHSLKLER